jgi:hypothetical protein
LNFGPYEIALIGGGFTLLGVLVGGLIGYRFSLALVKRQEFAKAASAFKSAFIQELRYLDHRYAPNRMGSDGVYKTLSDAFDRHEIAVINFRPYLCRKQRIGFDRAWDDYCNKENGRPHFMIYAEPENMFDADTQRKVYLKHLNKLLTYADG